MKAIFSAVLLSLAVTACVIVYRTVSYVGYEQVAATSRSQTMKMDLDAAVQRFAAGIRYPTISYDDPALLDVAAFQGFRQHLVTSFPRVHAAATPRVINDHSLLYEFRGSKESLKPVLFMAHMDVVPVDEVTRNEWRYPPFEGLVVDDVIWGRGTIDDKITVFALLEAMEAHLAANTPLERTVYFAFGHDEEVGGPRGAAAIADYLAKEGVSLEFVLDEGGFVTEGILPGIASPVAIIGVAEKGFANFRLTVDAPGGHSLQPPDNTAVGILSQAIVRLEANQLPADIQYTAMTMHSVWDEMPFMTRMAFANLWLFEPLIKKAMTGAALSAASIRSTIAPTMLTGSSKSNVLPTRASAVVNVRILPGDSVASVREHFVAAIDDPRVIVSSFMENQASAVSSTDSLGYRLIEKNIRAMDDSIIVAPYLVPGGTDSKHFYQLSPNIYRFTMAKADANTIKRMHGVNEQLPVSDYERAVMFFYHLLRDAAGE